MSGFFLACAMECMCTQTRPWIVLWSERVLGGMESEPMLTPEEKSHRLENFSSEEDRTHDAASKRTASPTHYQQAVPASTACNKYVCSCHSPVCYY